MRSTLLKGLFHVSHLWFIYEFDYFTWFIAAAFFFQPDDSLLDLEIQGPSYTPPIKDYITPAGAIRDITDKFERTFIDADELIEEILGSQAAKKRKKRIGKA